MRVALFLLTSLLMAACDSKSAAGGAINVGTPASTVVTTQPTTRPGTGTTVAEGMEMTIALPATNEVGLPVCTTVTLRNITNKNLWYRAKRPEEYSFGIRAKSRHGAAVRHVPAPLLSGGEAVLKPGEVFERNFDLRDRLDLGSNSYLISVGVVVLGTDEKRKVIWIDDVPFTIVPAAEKRSGETEERK